MKFFLYASNQSEPSDMVLEKIKLDINLPTKILIHGWFGTGNNEFIKKLADQYNKKGKYNIVGQYRDIMIKNCWFWVRMDWWTLQMYFLGIDWSKHSKKDYISSSCTARDVGKAISEFILEILKNDLEKLPNIHLIGHSLGAQVAAFTGKEMQSKTGKKIGRITGRFEKLYWHIED